MSLAPVLQDESKKAEEGQRPKANPFFTALAKAQSRPRPQTPLQKLRAELNRLERVAEAGDIVGWNTQLPVLGTLAKQSQIHLEKNLSLRVQIKKMEMTLLLNAGNKALEQAKRAEKEAQSSIDPKMAEQLLNKSKKLSQLGGRLHEQLIAKTN